MLKTLPTLAIVYFPMFSKSVQRECRQKSGHQFKEKNRFTQQSPYISITVIIRFFCHIFRNSEAVNTLLSTKPFLPMNLSSKPKQFQKCFLSLAKYLSHRKRKKNLRNLTHFTPVHLRTRFAIKNARKGSINLQKHKGISSGKVLYIFLLVGGLLRRSTLPPVECWKLFGAEDEITHWKNKRNYIPSLSFFSMQPYYRPTGGFQRRDVASS